MPKRAEKKGERQLDDLDAEILDPRSRRINLSNQEGALNCPVLEKVRSAMHRNELFHVIDLSDNILNDDCIATVSALMKDRNYLVRYEMRNCCLNDKQLTLHLIPALLLKKRVTALHIDKNIELTDECIDSICRLILETNLTELSMIGTSITPAGGSKIAAAVERSPLVVVCQLPYSVGFRLLDTIESYLKRNKTKFSDLEKHVVAAPDFKSSPDEWNYQDQRVLHAYRTKKKRRQALIMNPLDGENGDFSISRTVDVSYTQPEYMSLPHIKSRSHLPELSLPKKKHFPSKDISNNNISGCTNTRSMINSWADPTVKHTLISLHMLTERSSLHHRREKLVRNRMKETNGLDPQSVQSARVAHHLPAVMEMRNQKSLIS